ncbi:Manganese-binding lipoprotein MntA [Cellulomonas sp. T2.31MG-18]|uniref:metal ABC transporter solute-binding protein, Zn/Mn family n=1 Tax=Cellulomonas sp. T2.31MG-18 TaxID=3157619 RepID=UPI0035F05B90
MTLPRCRLSRLALAVPAITVVATLAACAGSPAAGTTAGASGSTATAGAVPVVASTNVYGSLVTAVGGSAVSVTSLISDPSADPHSYQASAQTQLVLSKAKLVVENGGGYDDFVDTMLGALPDRPTVINAVDVSGKAASAGKQLNEHVWYDLPSMVLVVQRISSALQQLAPAQSAQISANAAALTTQLQGIESSVAQLKAAHAGQGVAITEPVPLYLLDAAGLVNRTPPELSAAIEDETDVSPAVLQQTLQLFTSHSVAALVYNAQTTGAQTDQLIAAAKQAGVPTVPVTETLPPGDTYVTWMQANVAALSQALGR